MTQKKILLFISFSIILLLASITCARDPIRTITGTVTKVSDGDTITVHTPDETKLKVRLYGIDAPETAKYDHRTGRISKPGQPFGNESRSYLSSMILHKVVRLDVMDVDPYHRMVSIVWMAKWNVNLAVIRAGMGEAYVEYLKVKPYKTQFVHAEQEAKEKRLGIWSRTVYERPRDFKKRHKVSGE